MIDIESLRETYAFDIANYKKLGEELTKIFHGILDPKTIHTITSREKGLDSLINKVVEKEKYQVLTDITDLCGVRVITNMESDISEVGAVLRQHFTIDEQNSCDHRIKAANNFGYMSLHLVMSLGADREYLPENTALKSLKAEVQVRSILQHAWAEIEHDLGYKSEQQIPEDLKRGSNRLSAILEAADLEFVRLKNMKEAHIKEARAAVNGAVETQTPIDSLSIAVVDEQNEVLKNIRQMLEKKFHVQFTKKGDYSNILAKFNFFNIKYLEELETGLNSRSGELFKFVELLFERREDNPKYIRFEAPLEYYLHFLGSKNEEQWDDYRYNGQSCGRTITEVVDFVVLHHDATN